MNRKAIPQQKTPTDEVVRQLEEIKQADVDWKGGRVFSLVYHGGPEHEDLIKRSHGVFSSANLLNPTSFKGLRRLEAEVTQMTAGLFNGPPTTVGCVTSGGTESILVAMHAYRERARKEKPWIRHPEVVVPRTIHPAFDKAAHYFGMKLRRAELGDDMRVSLKSMARKIGRNTIALVASAPQYAHGVVDPIAEVAELAQKHGLPMHVDACVGGFVLPWLEKLGKRVAPWDFRVPGVTSISADIHKYGYAGKGASLLMWRSMADMRHQIFVATEFPGGIYVSPTIIGTRPGGPIASAWGALVGQGEVGYLELTRKAWEASERFREGIAEIPGLKLLGDPDATIVAWTHAPGGPEVYGVAERMEARGWTIDRCQKPPCVHLTVTANHLAIVDEYLQDLRESAAEVSADPKLARAGTAATYGMMAKVPIRGMVGASVRKFFEQMYSPGVIVPDLSSVQGDGLVDKLVARYGAQITGVLDKVEDVRERVAKIFR